MKSLNLQSRYKSIDFIKGICILFVIISHYKWSDVERLQLLFPFWIDMAVPIFMIISGFVYTKSFYKNNIKSIRQAYDVQTFLGKIIRYSVPFIIAFIVEEIGYGIIGYVHHNIKEMGFCFLRGGFGPGSYYYPVMIQFIFYFPVIFFIINKFRFNGLMLCGFINCVYEILKCAYGMNIDCYRLLVFRYTFLIAYGCYLAMGGAARSQRNFQ